MEKILNLINNTFVFKIRNTYISPTYWQAGAIVILLFLLIWTLARLRYLYVHWSLGKGSIAMVFWGFILAIVLEGFLFIGGKTLMTEIFGWENAPKPISTFLDIGRRRIVKVLGANDEINNIKPSQETPSSKSVILDYQSLSEDDAQTVESFICIP